MQFLNFSSVSRTQKCISQGIENVFGVISALLVFLAPVHGPKPSSRSLRPSPIAFSKACYMRLAKSGAQKSRKCFKVGFQAPKCDFKLLDNAFKPVSALPVPLTPPDALIKLSKPPTKPKCIFQGLLNAFGLVSTNLEFNAIPEAENRTASNLIWFPRLHDAFFRSWMVSETHVELFQLC